MGGEVNARLIGVAEARAFFAHPTQRKGASLDDLPSEGVEYWASGHICAVFRDFSWPGVLDVHCGVKPEGWGQVVPHAKAILNAVWDHHQPQLIVAQSQESNRAVLAFNRRLGFQIFGHMPMPSGRIVQQYWRQ